MRDEFITSDGEIVDIRKVAAMAKGFGTVTSKAKLLREALESGLDLDDAIQSLSKRIY